MHPNDIGHGMKYSRYFHRFMVNYDINYQLVMISLNYYATWAPNFERILR